MEGFKKIVLLMLLFTTGACFNYNGADDEWGSLTLTVLAETGGEVNTTV